MYTNNNAIQKRKHTNNLKEHCILNLVYELLKLTLFLNALLFMYFQQNIPFAMYEFIIFLKQYTP